MKYISVLCLIVGVIFCACNHNDEVELEIALPISATFLPATIESNINSIDDEQKRALIHLVNNQYIVNDASQLPNDPIGFSDTYRNINFDENTLLIKYMLHDYAIDTYSNRYYRNTKENSYNWSVNIGTASDTDIVTDFNFFTRFAILVKKLPADAKVKFWYGLTQLGAFPNHNM